MARTFCQRAGCPRRTNQGRLICAACVLADHRKANGFRKAGRPKAVADISDAEIERRFQQAKLAARRAA